MIEVPRAEAPLLGIKAKCDLAPFQDYAVLIAEHRKKHAALEVGATAVPVDVEVGGERRISAPFEDIEPPGIVVSADAHVVRDKIEDQAHVVGVQSIDQRAEIRVAADLGVEPVVIDDVIPMGRAGARLA